MPLPNFDNLPTISPTLIERLLAADELAAQAALLREGNLLHANGLAALLEEADRLAGNDPSKTWKLARLAARVADEADAPAAHPRAAYLRGYVHAMRGQFAEAREMVETARAGYEELGMELEALRTNVGLMRILGEMGKFQEAIAIGQNVIEESVAEVSAPNSEKAQNHQIHSLIAKTYNNLGICFERTGEYANALSAYSNSQNVYTETNMSALAANVMTNKAGVYMYLGQVQASLQILDQALSVYRDQNLPLSEAQTLINIGETNLFSSNYAQALNSLERAKHLLDEFEDLSDYSILLRQMGDAYLALNLSGEALDLYRQAKAFFEETELSHHHALLLWSSGIALVNRGQIDEAVLVFTQSALILRQQQNFQLLSALLLEQSALATTTRNTNEAVALAQEALDLLKNSEYPVQKVYAYLRNAELALLAKPLNLARAETLLNAAQPLVDELALPQLRYRLQGRWGQFHRLQGNDAAAEQALLAAIDEIEALHSTLVQERMRASFLDDKLSIYQELMALYLERGDTEQAFALAERAKSRALADLLSGAIETRLVALDEASVGEREMAQTAQLRALQAELNAIYNEMLGDGGAPADEDEPHARAIDPTLLRGRAVELEQSISRLQLQSQVSSSRKSGSVNGEAAAGAYGIAELTANKLSEPDFLMADSLTPNTPLLVYHVIGDEILAFVQAAGKTHVLRHLCTVGDVQPSLRRLAAQWSRFQAGQRFAGRHQQQMERSVRRVLGDLYDLLMRSIVVLLETESPTWRAGCTNDQAQMTKDGVPSLAIVPHSLLHQLPFHALHDGERYLLERCAISYAPSATVFGLTQRRPLTLHGAPLVLGVPDARIPAAAVEVERVAAHLRARQLAPQALVGEAATLARLAGYREGSLLHLACHGLFRGDNPMFSALKLHDGWLTANDVAQLRLPPSLVTLSACESGRSGGLHGSEILGLTYAFLSAGASALLVSGWLVQDDAAALLMGGWYAQLGAGVDLAEALRQAQLQVKAQYPHPYYWAPFLLVGKRRVD